MKMSKNIVIIGGMGLGKDYTVNKIRKHYNLTKVVTTTTRPIRSGEIDGVTYNFVSEEEFLGMDDRCKFIETQKYSTVNGVWYYGTTKESTEKDNTIIILDKDGYLEYKKYVPNCVSIYISCIDETERFYRAIKRLSNCSMKDVDEVYRRIRTDEDKFKDIYDLVDFTIPQLYNETTIDLVFDVLDRVGIEKRESENNGN